MTTRALVAGILVASVSLLAGCAGGSQHAQTAEQAADHPNTDFIKVLCGQIDLYPYVTTMSDEDNISAAVAAAQKSGVKALNDYADEILRARTIVAQRNIFDKMGDWCHAHPDLAGPMPLSNNAQP